MKTVWIIVLALALMNAYVAVSIRLRLADMSRATGIIAAIFISFFALQLVVPLFDWNLALIKHEISGDIYDFLVRAAYLVLGVLSCLLVITLLCDIVWLPLRSFLPSSVALNLGFALLGFTLLVTAGTVANGIFHAGAVEVVRVDLSLKNLPKALDGFKIVQISDTHIGRFLKSSFVKKITKIVTELDPDLIAMTGDIADGYVENLSQEVKEFAELKAVYGKYYVTGNHEYYWGASEWMKEAEKLGFRVLTNEHVVLEKEGHKIVIAGVPDYTSLRVSAGHIPNPVKAMAGAPADSVKIMLSHQPNFIEQAQQLGINVQLSGHTHAGQYFPFTKLIGFVQSYHKGLYKIGETKLYVSKGTGFWGPSLRDEVGEITLITLKSE